jgi:hypothetical protein
VKVKALKGAVTTSTLPSTRPKTGSPCAACSKGAFAGTVTTLLVRAGGAGNERSDMAEAELGRLLAAAGGYRVFASDGTHLGWLDHVRYERHADRPDEVVVCSRRLLAKRRRVFPFSSVAEVRRGERTVVLRGTRTE